MLGEEEELLTSLARLGGQKGVRCAQQAAVGLTSQGCLTRCTENGLQGRL